MTDGNFRKFVAFVEDRVKLLPIPIREIVLQSLHTRFERTESRRSRRAPLYVLFLVAGLGFLASTATRAEATCGDYLAHHDQTNYGLITLPAGMQLTTQIPSTPIPNRLPCHGPSCRKGPIELPLSTPVVSLETQDRWGWTACATLPALEQTSFLSRAIEPLCLPMIAFRLDRPPKV